VSHHPSPDLVKRKGSIRTEQSKSSFQKQAKNRRSEEEMMMQWRSSSNFVYCIGTASRLNNEGVAHAFYTSEAASCLTEVFVVGCWLCDCHVNNLVGCRLLACLLLQQSSPATVWILATIPMRHGVKKKSLSNPSSFPLHLGDRSIHPSKKCSIEV